MATTKKNSGRKSNPSKKETLLSNLNTVPEKVKKYSANAVSAVNNLSTTQKVIGGALLVLGAGYLTRRAGLLRNAGRLATSVLAMVGRDKSK